MCHPAISIAATLISTAMSGYASYASGKSQEKAAEYNAKQSELDATAAQQAASAEAAQRKQQTQELIGRQRAVAAANGGVVDTGTNLDLFASTAAKGQMDAAAITDNAQRQANALRTQAGLERYQGKAAAQAGILGAAAQGVAGVSSAVGTYTTYKYNTKMLNANGIV